MERGQINIINPKVNNNPKVIVRASEILKKSRTYQDKTKFREQ